LTVTPELDQPLQVHQCLFSSGTFKTDFGVQILRQNMAFLHKTLPGPTFRRIWRECFDTLQDLLFSDLLLKQDFTTLGAARLMQDYEAIQAVVQSHVGHSNAALSMPRLREGVTLLNVPVEAEEGRNHSLREVSQQIFDNNRMCQIVLDNMGISRIMPKEARAILQRRVEASD
jgi:hypothetical protein